ELPRGPVCGFSIVVSFDPSQLTLVTEPIYHDDFLDVAFAPFSARIGLPGTPMHPQGRHGILVSASSINAEKLVETPARGVLTIATILFRVLAEPATECHLSFSDQFSLPGSESTGCAYNYICFFDDADHTAPLRSTRNVPGAITVV